MQSTPQNGLHVGIIMDGNGRWARARGRPREWGHRRGAQTVRAVVESAPDHGVSVLTLYAFSSDNWRRPPREVEAIMRLLGRYLRSERARMVDNGVRLAVIGRRDRLDPGLREEIERSEGATAAGTRLQLRLAVDYSSRQALLRAIRDVDRPEELSEEGFASLLGKAMHAPAAAPDVDLLIRTGGEQRLSDFLLWESAYAELYFTPRMWPDFAPSDLGEAIRAFRSRERRFGGLAEAV